MTRPRYRHVKAPGGALSTRQLADRWNVLTERIIEWIRLGELEAIDVRRKAGEGRARYRFSLEKVKEFEERRATTNKPAEPKRRKKKKKIDSNEKVIEFFP